MTELPTADVPVAQLTIDHLPVIGGDVREVVRVIDLSGYPDYTPGYRIEWVPPASPLDEPPTVTDYAADDTVPVVAAADWYAQEVTA